MSRVVTLAALIVAVSACAGVAARASDLDTRARSACAGMGLDVSEAPFAYCVISLRQSAAAN